MNTEERKVSEEFVWKLIGEVKEVNKEVSADIKAQSDAIVNLVNVFRKRFDGEPKMSEMKVLIDTYAKEFSNYHGKISDKFIECKDINTEIHKLLKDHCDHASSCFANIDTTLGDEDSFFQNIMSGIDTIKKRVNTMIVVVLVSFSILAISYLFVRSAVDSVIHKKMTAVEEHYQKDLKEDISRIEKLVERHIKETKNGNHK